MKRIAQGNANRCLPFLLATGVLAMLTVLVLADRRPLPLRLYTAIYKIEGAEADLFSMLNSRAAVFRMPYQSALAVNGYQSISVTPGWGGVGEDVMLGLAPAFFTPGLNRAAIIGSGTGVTPAGSAAAYAHTALVDLDPNTPAILQYFKQANGNILAHPSVDLVVEDAFSWLTRQPRVFDLIVNGPTSPANRDAGALFSLEFMQLAKTRLRPGGIFAVWVGVVDRAEGSAVLWQTVQAVFKYARWIKIQPNYYEILASDQPIRFRGARPGIISRLTPKQRALLREYFLLTHQSEQNGACDPWPLLREGAEGLSLRHLGEAVRRRTRRPIPYKPHPGRDGGSHATPAVTTLNRPILQSLASISWNPGHMGLSRSEANEAMRWFERRFPSALCARP